MPTGIRGSRSSTCLSLTRSGGSPPARWACSLPRACSVTPSRKPMTRRQAQAGGVRPASPSGPSLFGPRRGRPATSRATASPIRARCRRHRAAPLGGPRPHGRRRGARGEPDRGAARVAPPVEVSGPGVSATTREFVDAVLGLLAALVATRSSRSESGHEDDGRRRDPPLLEAEGVDVMFGIPGGAIMPTYDAMARGTTVRHVLARHEQGAGHMACRDTPAPPVASAWRSPRRDRARRTSSRRSPTRMDSTPLVCITGQVRSTLIGTDAFQEQDITGITMPIVKHSWLVQDARDPRRARCGVPRRPNRPLRPCPRRHPTRRPGGGDRLRLSRLGRPPGLAAADEGAPALRPRGRPGDRPRARRRPVRGRGSPERRRLRRAAAARRGGDAARHHDADGQGRFLETHELHRLAGDARGPSGRTSR